MSLKKNKFGEEIRVKLCITITLILAIFCSCGFDFNSSNGQVAIKIDREIFKYYSSNSIKIYLFVLKNEITVLEDEMEYSDLDNEYFINLDTDGIYTIEIKAYYSSRLVAAGKADNVKITNDSVNEVNLFLTLFIDKFIRTNSKYYDLIK